MKVMLNLHLIQELASFVLTSKLNRMHKILLTVKKYKFYITASFTNFLKNYMRLLNQKKILKWFTLKLVKPLCCVCLILKKLALLLGQLCVMVNLREKVLLLFGAVKQKLEKVKFQACSVIKNQ